MEDIISKLNRTKGGDLTRETENSARVAERKEVHEAITDGLLQPHGLLPNTKQDGIFRLLSENPNSFNNRITGNRKLDKAINLKDEPRLVIPAGILRIPVFSSPVVFFYRNHDSCSSGTF